MLLAAIGDERSTSAWGQVASRHARWLGLEPRVETFAPDAGRSAAVVLAWASALDEPPNPPYREGRLLHASGDLDDLRCRPAPGALGKVWEGQEPTNLRDAKILVSLETGELRALLGPTAVDQLVYATPDEGAVVTNDLRLLIRLRGLDLDPVGVYAVLQHGAAPAPWTVQRGVARLPAGHALELRAGSPGRVAPSAAFAPAAGNGTSDDAAVAPAAVVRSRLDALLAEVPTGTTLYFSGGVDSGLLAARLAALGRRDLLLLNYSFGADDEESEVAGRMAAALELPLERVTFDAAAVRDLLDRVPSDYAFPFADTSVVPTNLLVGATAARLPRGSAVLDGTGADGIFGLGVKRVRWRRVYAVPAPLRRAAAHAYERRALWARAGRLEQVGRVARRSVELSPTCAAVTAQNALAGIAYDASDDTKRRVDHALVENVRAIAPALGAAERFSLVDVVHVCAGEFAAKSHWPLRRRGLRAFYPFLEPSLVAAVAEVPSRLRHDKAVLKDLLAAQVPPELVYRRKSAFVAPLGPLFSLAPVQELLDDVLRAPASPLRPFLRTDVVAELVLRARDGRPLGVGAYYFLWAVAFASRWLTGASRLQ